MVYLAYAAYGLYLLLIAAGGVMAVRCTSLVRALLGLILALLGVAGMYLLMAAPFLAFMQILIYGGAVSVLIFFAVMLTRAPSGEAATEGGPRRRGQLGLAVLAGLLPAALLGGAVLGFAPEALPLKPEASLAKLGEFLVGPYVLAFELISVVLFVAMAGAVLMGFERRRAR